MSWSNRPAPPPGPLNDFNHPQWTNWANNELAAHPHPGCPELPLEARLSLPFSGDEFNVRTDYQTFWDYLPVEGDSPTDWERDPDGYIELEDGRDFILYKRLFPTLVYEPIAYIKVTFIFFCFTYPSLESYEIDRREFIFGIGASVPPLIIPHTRENVVEWRWVEASKHKDGRNVRVPRRPEPGDLPRTDGLEPHYKPEDELKRKDETPPNTDQVSFRLSAEEDGKAAVFLGARLLGEMTIDKPFVVPRGVLSTRGGGSSRFLKGPFERISPIARIEEIHAWSPRGEDKAK